MASTLVEQFDRDGYVVVENLFSESEVARMKHEIQRVLDEVRRVATAEGRPNPAQNGVYVGLAAKSDLFRQVAADNRLVNVLRQVMGESILFLSDKVVYKSAETGFRSPWHQDWSYWRGSNKISVWIALDPSTEENGCLKFIPGSHRSVVKHDGVASDGKGFQHRLRQEDVDESKAISLPCAPGTAVVFHDLTLHASHENTSGKDRWALISTYKDATAEDPDYPWAVAAFQVSGTARA